ncbi:cytochrome P450 71A9-like [Lolium perenne]|uniref:cytochrome P450 71A9-like n=1 Tax=Lolium perenne TaxID=4522 RepID=UPI003A98D95C
MAELIQNPRAMAKLRDEVARVSNGNPTTEEDDLHGMEYLKAVLKESLRLHPPAPLLVRTTPPLSAPVDGSAPPSAALPAAEIALAGLVGHFDWELPIGTRLDMSEAPGLTTPPLAPLRLLPKCKTLV